MPQIKIGIGIVLALGVAYAFWPREEVKPPLVPKAKIAQPVAPVAKKAAEAGPAAAREPEATAKLAEPQPEAAPAPISLKPARGSIVGVVTDQKGAAIAGALVQSLAPGEDGLTYATGRTTRTDASGAYELGPFEALRKTVVEASASGFAVERREAYPGLTLDFVLAAGGSLSGHVRFLGTDEPVADAVLLLYRRRLERLDWHRYTFPWAETRTDGTGFYRFGAIPADVDRVRIYPAAHPEPRTGTIDVSVRSGTETGQDYYVGAATGIRVRGHVRDADQQTPVIGARIWHWRNPRVVAVSDAEGRYELSGVDPEGLCTGDLNVRAPGYLRIHTGLITHLSSAARVLEHDLHLRKAAAITGRVVDGNGCGVSGARVSGGPGVKATTGADGGFCLPEVTPYGNQNTVRVAAEGFERYVSAPITIRPGEV